MQTKTPTSQSSERSHLVYWTAAKCDRCGSTIRNRGNGMASSRADCPEAPEKLCTQRHDFAHGSRGSLTTWNDQRKPTAEEILRLSEDQWRRVIKYEN